MNISRLIEHLNRIKSPFWFRQAFRMETILLNLFYSRCTRPEAGVSPDGEIVVSMTSHRDRIRYAYIAVTTILRQTVKPKAVVLYLAEEEFPNREKDLPRSLASLAGYGLQFRFCDNLYPHKKYYYAFSDYPESPVVTVDDDVFYPENLLESLISMAQEYPGYVCCHWARMITVENGDIAPYRHWQEVKNGAVSSVRLVPIGCCGVLYPPHALGEQTFDQAKLKTLSLMTDDLWLKWNELLSGTGCVCGGRYRQFFPLVLGVQRYALNRRNVLNGANDDCVRRLNEAFPEVRERILEGDDT